MAICRVTRWGGLVLALVLIAPVAWAQPVDAPGPTPSEATTRKVEALYAEGAALYRAGKFRAAIARFEQAYALYPEPNLLYNIGRCREATGQVQAAIKLYERFVAAEGATAHIQDKARARLKMLRAASERSAATRGVAPPRATAPGAVAPASASAEPAPGSRRSSAITVTKWIIGGLALAAAGGGTVAYLLGADDHAQVDDAVAEAQGGIVQLTRVEAVDLRDSGETKQIVGYALWGVAAAALVTSAILFAVDGGAGEEQPAAPAVTLSPSGGGLVISGRF